MGREPKTTVPHDQTILGVEVAFIPNHMSIKTEHGRVSPPFHSFAVYNSCYLREMCFASWTQLIVSGVR